MNHRAPRRSESGSVADQTGSDKRGPTLTGLVTALGLEEVRATRRPDLRRSHGRDHRYGDLGYGTSVAEDAGLELIESSSAVVHWIKDPKSWNP